MLTEIWDGFMMMLGIIVRLLLYQDIGFENTRKLIERLNKNVD